MDLQTSPIEGTSSDKHDILDQLARKPLDADELEAKKILLKSISSDKIDVSIRFPSFCTSSDEDYTNVPVGYLTRTRSSKRDDLLWRLRREEIIKALEGRPSYWGRTRIELARSNQPYPKRTIKVQALNGETCTVEAYRFDRAKDVKAKACEKLRLSTERRTLVYNGKELDDMSDLSSIDTSVECKFQLLPKTGLGLVDSVKSLFEYFRNGAHRLVEWFPDFFMDMSRALTEKDLSRISQAIGSGWKHLGAELGISQAEIDQICEDNRKTSMKIFNMLRQWSIQASVNATVNTLHNAMKNCRKVTFDMKAIERVFAGI